MALKGNLLYNGDFEVGDTSGWVVNPFGKSGVFSLTTTTDKVKAGSYAGKFSPSGAGSGYLAYNKSFAFEEYEGYLFIGWLYMSGDYYHAGYLWGLDDKGNLLDEFFLGINLDSGVWKKFVGILKAYGELTHFQIGVHAYAFADTDIHYIDEFKIIPIESLRSVVIHDKWKNATITAGVDKWYDLICMGQARVYSILHVTDVSGTDPTLNVTIKPSVLEDINLCNQFSHTQFTGTGAEEKYLDVSSVNGIKVEYRVGGTDPSFTINHYLKVVPL